MIAYRRTKRFTVLAIAVTTTLAWSCSDPEGSVLVPTDTDAEALRKACGDGRCGRRETCTTCPIDCGPCAPGTESDAGADTESGAVDQTERPPVLFANGWENRSEIGCSLEGLLDGPGGVSSTWWNDFGPYLGATCGTPSIAEIVTAEKHDGERALQVNFEPDGSQNGPDFRIAQGFDDRTEIYARWWIKYSTNWVWAGADHKLAIFGEDGGGQNIYYNVRGNGNGGNGRVVIHVIPADTLFEDTSTDVAPGIWHLCEIHIVAGANGRVEAKLDGRLLTLTNESGGNPLSVNTGPSIGYIKLDTTYNLYSYPTSLGLSMKTWYDSVAVGTASWIGGR
jgi:hypothetical protein